MKNNDTTQEIAVLSLINKHFWKSKVGPISALAIPLFLMIVYKIIGKDEIELKKMKQNMAFFSKEEISVFL